MGSLGVMELLVIGAILLIVLALPIAVIVILVKTQKKG